MVDKGSVPLVEYEAESFVMKKVRVVTRLQYLLEK
jgi:hypothetical protein